MEITVPPGTDIPAVEETTSRPGINSAVGNTALIVLLPLVHAAVNVCAITSPSVISLSSTLKIFVLTVVVVPSTVKDPFSNRSPPTSALFYIVTLPVLSPLIQATVPEPITNCLLPPDEGRTYVALVEFSSSAGPMITLPVPAI